MGRQAKHSVSVGPNHRVGFSMSKRDGFPYYYVRYLSPDGKYPAVSTGETTMTEAIEVAEGIILKAYGAKVEVTSWTDAMRKFRDRAETLGRRPKTIEGYEDTLIQLQNFLSAKHPSVLGPRAVTVEMAMEFRDQYKGTFYKRGKNGERRFRKLVSLDTTLGTLRSIWGAWFITELKLCKDNPWASVQGPKLDKQKVIPPTDEEVKAFFDWLNKRFNGWRLPVLFFETKEHCVNRLADLCCAKSSQLANGFLTFPASIVKGREDRAVPLPKQMYEELQQIAGSTYLWEKQGSDLKPILKAKGWPTHRVIDGFCPDRFYQWIEGLTVRYREETEKRIKTHDFRKRAFTNMFRAGIPTKQASIAGGCNEGTMLRNYVAFEEQAVTNDVFAKMMALKASGDLKLHTIATENEKKHPPKTLEK